MSFSISSLLANTPGNFRSIALSSDGTKCIGSNYSDLGMFYSSNSGVTWIQSNIITGYYNSVALSSDGIFGIASSGLNDGIYYTSDSGLTWAQSNVTTGAFFFSSFIIRWNKKYCWQWYK